jgi:hypothetical protein
MIVQEKNIMTGWFAGCIYHGFLGKSENREEKGGEIISWL